MKIVYRKRFQKQFDRLPSHKQLSVKSTIDCLRRDPHNSALRNHKLKGGLQGYRAISAGYDLRIVFEEQGKYAIVIMISIGSHDQVY